jgi:hypothetical protein
VTLQEIAYDGGALTLPTGWREEPDVDPFLVLLVPERTGDAFVANLHVVREIVNGTDADVSDHLDALASSLDDHHLIDLEECPGAGRPGGARLVSLHTRWRAFEGA